MHSKTVPATHWTVCIYALMIFTDRSVIGERIIQQNRLTDLPSIYWKQVLSHRKGDLMASVSSVAPWTDLWAAAGDSMSSHYYSHKRALTGCRPGRSHSICDDVPDAEFPDNFAWTKSRLCGSRRCRRGVHIKTSCPGVQAQNLVQSARRSRPRGPGKWRFVPGSIWSKTKKPKRHSSEHTYVVKRALVTSLRRIFFYYDSGSFLGSIISLRLLHSRYMGIYYS